MNRFVVLKQSFPVAVAYLLQTIAPAVSAVLLLPVLCEFYNQRLEQHYVILALLSAAFALLVVKPHDDITVRINSVFFSTLRHLMLRWAVVLSILLFIGFASEVSAEFSRRVITTWIFLVPLVAAGAIAGLSAILRRVLGSPHNIRSAVFAGFNESSKRFAQRICDSPDSFIKVEGFFDDRNVHRLGLDGDFRLLGGLSDLRKYVDEHGIAVIFIALPMRHVQRVMSMLDDLRDTTVSIYYLPDVFVFDLIQSQTVEIQGTPAVALCETPFHGFRGVVKRVGDIVIASLLLCALLPIFLLVAAGVKFTSPGSIIFKQRRYGLDGKEIVVYKFRTMTVSEDGDDFVQAKKNDSRITPIGHVLRRYSLDELPQLINVLQGRMSLVGPRPHPIALNEQYRNMIKGYMLRHKVLPGLTGLAQINGCRGETAKVEEMQARIHYDLEYLRRWTPLLDLKILFLTAFRMFNDEQAY